MKVEVFQNSIDKFLAAFYQDIRRVISEGVKGAPTNVILTGSNVLALHGLKISWSPQDLDVAIYEPTPGQRLFIVGGGDVIESEFEACLDYESAKEKGITQRAWKKSVFFQGEQLTLNFILEKGPKPLANLNYLYGGLYLPVQNIDKIIEAKLSYGEGKDKSFLRRKDAHHLSELKSLNFNVNQ